MSGSMWPAATVAVVLLVLSACDGDDNAADAVGERGAGSAEGVPQHVAGAAEASAGDRANEGDDGHADADVDEDHDGEDHDESRLAAGMGSHEHGSAELSVAWSEREVFVDLISPTHNIFGFEHEPSSDEERSLVAERTDALSTPGVIIINEEAGCELADDVATEVEIEGSHGELTASWLFVCDHPDDIRHLDIAGLFAEFPNLEDIDAQWASPTGQSAAELSPTSTVLGLE